MKRIDTSKWTEFIVGKLFPNIVKPHVYHSREVKESIDGIPYIVRSKYNNGIKCRVKATGIITSPKGVISFGAENASFFYQNEEWCSGRDIYYIDTQDISDYACMYLTACLNRITDKYSYNYGLFPDLLKKEKLLLPTTPSGDPDWEYMENYMRKYEQQTNASITALKHLADTHKSKRIDTSAWQEFLFDDIFDVIKGTRLTKANMKKGDINYIGATAFNNGVTAKIGNDEHIHPAGTLSVCYNGSIGQTFYQTDPYWATDDVNVLYPKFEINQYIAQFLASIIYQIGQKFDYKDKWTAEKMKKTKILLPATQEGTPNWNLMEQYMRQVELQVKNSIIALTTPTPQVQQQTNLVNYGTVNIYEK